MVDDDFGSSGLVINGTGFIDVDEIDLHNNGSCILVQAGRIIANIRKMTTRNLNHFNPPYSPTVQVSGGDGTQNLILYFDEIINSRGGDAVGVSNGRATLIGRRIYSEFGLSLNLTASIVSAFIQADEIISGTKGIKIGNSNEQIIIEANYIEGKSHNTTSGVVTCATNSNLVLRNAKIKNVGSANNSVGIYIDTNTSHTIEIENIIVVTFDSTIMANQTIFKAGSGINIKNLGLFVNKDISSNITLQIGTATNKKYISDPLVS